MCKDGPGYYEEMGILRKKPAQKPVFFFERGIWYVK